MMNDGLFKTSEISLKTKFWDDHFACPVCMHKISVMFILIFQELVIHQVKLVKFYNTWTNPLNKRCGLFWSPGRSESRHLDLGADWTEHERRVGVALLHRRQAPQLRLGGHGHRYHRRQLHRRSPVMTICDYEFSGKGEYHSIVF